MLDGTNPYGPAYYRKRAQEVLKFAELSRFDDVRGFLEQIARQYHLLADRIEALARSAACSQSPADEIASRPTPPGDTSDA